MLGPFGSDNEITGPAGCLSQSVSRVTLEITDDLPGGVETITPILRKNKTREHAER